MNLRKAMSLAVVLAACVGLAIAAPQAPPAAAAAGQPTLEAVPTALLIRNGAAVERLVRLDVLPPMPGVAGSAATVTGAMGEYATARGIYRETFAPDSARPGDFAARREVEFATE